jgi:hypothetical protein
MLSKASKKSNRWFMRSKKWSKKIKRTNKRWTQLSTNLESSQMIRSNSKLKNTCLITKSTLTKKSQRSIHPDIMVSQLIAMIMITRIRFKNSLSKILTMYNNRSSKSRKTIDNMHNKQILNNRWKQ